MSSSPPRIIHRNGLRLLVCRGRSGDATGWVVIDLEDRGGVSGAFRLVSEAEAAARSYADAYGVNR